jgi:hypothetical protein
MVPKPDDTLGERMQKIEFRSFDRSNTRLNINNVDLAQKKLNRERALNYWKDKVMQDFLPPINESRNINKNSNADATSNTVENPAVSKLIEYKIVKTVAHMQKNESSNKGKYPTSSEEEYEDFDDIM